MTLLLDTAAAGRPVKAFGTAARPDPVAVPEVPGAGAGYLFLLVAAVTRWRRRRALLRQLAERPDHVLVDAGVPLDLVRGAQAYVNARAKVEYTGR